MKWALVVADFNRIFVRHRRNIIGLRSVYYRLVKEERAAADLSQKKRSQLAAMNERRGLVRERNAGNVVPKRPSGNIPLIGSSDERWISCRTAVTPDTARHNMVW